MINSLKGWLEHLANIDEHLGFKKILQYSLLFLFIMFIFNWKSVIRDGIEIFSEISDELHNEKMELRDQLLSELNPILGEFRSDTGADRLLYFEYHNSKENLVSIPFKYVDLVQQNSKYSISPVNEEKFKNINAGLITSIYDDVKGGDLVYCSSPYDETFNLKYPGMFNWLNEQDGSRRHVYLSIPGISQPVGLIILEWMNESNEELDLDRITKIATQNYIPRINALILSKRKK